MDCDEQIVSRIRNFKKSNNIVKKKEYITELRKQNKTHTINLKRSLFVGEDFDDVVKKVKENYINISCLEKESICSDQKLAFVNSHLTLLIAQSNSCIEDLIAILDLSRIYIFKDNSIINNEYLKEFIRLTNMYLVHSNVLLKVIFTRKLFF